MWETERFLVPEPTHVLGRRRERHRVRTGEVYVPLAPHLDSGLNQLADGAVQGRPLSP